MCLKTDTWQFEYKFILPIKLLNKPKGRLNSMCPGWERFRAELVEPHTWRNHIEDWQPEREGPKPQCGKVIRPNREATPLPPLNPYPPTHLPTYRSSWFNIATGLPINISHAYCIQTNEHTHIYLVFLNITKSNEPFFINLIFELENWENPWNHTAVSRILLVNKSMRPSAL